MATRYFKVDQDADSESIRVKPRVDSSQRITHAKVAASGGDTAASGSTRHNLRRLTYLDSVKRKRSVDGTGSKGSPSSRRGRRKSGRSPDGGRRGAPVASIEDARESLEAEERELEAFVFGDPDALVTYLDTETPAGASQLEHLDRAGVEEDSDGSDSESDGDNGALETSRSPQSVWHDPDDETKVTQRDPFTGSKREKNHREHFFKVSAQPSWADISKAGGNDNYTSESERKLIQQTGHVLTSTKKFPQGTLQYCAMRRLNQCGPKECAKMSSVQFHTGAQVALTASSSSNRLLLYQVDGKENPVIESVMFERFPISCGRFSAEGSEVVVGSRFRKHLFVYDMMVGKIIRVPRVMGVDMKDTGQFRVSPAPGQRGVIAFLQASGPEIHLLSARSREYMCSVRVPLGACHAADFSPDGTHLYTFGDSGKVYIWDVRKMSNVEYVHAFTDQGCLKGTALAVSNSGSWIATGSCTGVVNLYDTSHASKEREPNPVKACLNLVTEVTDLRFNSTDEVLAMLSDKKENALRLLHTESMTVFDNFPAVAGPRARAATGAATGALVHTPCALDFSPNSGYFSVGNTRGEALLYRLNHYNSY